MRVLERDDPEFPKEALLVKNPPERLWVLGDLDLLKRPRVSIIGSRKPTTYGIRVAYEAARDLASAGVVVVSGMALGLDARAHQGALDAGGGTIAVLGCGIDIDYPLGNLALLRAVRERGLVITEFEPGLHPTKFTFPLRNRLIAEFGHCLLVVEGQIDGGTSNTVRWAQERRKIFAVPGQIDNPLASGPNLLIRDGAAAYLHPNDVLEYLKLPRLPADDAPAEILRIGREEAQQRRAQLSHAEAALYDLITPRPVHVDALAARSELGPGLLLAALSSLELQGLVTQLPGKHFALAS